MFGRSNPTLHAEIRLLHVPGQTAERILPELQRMEPGDLIPAGPGRNTRVRAPASLKKPLTLVWLVFLELVDFPLMRKCLLGIKRRAESA